jgi:aerobic-type carbon monoxide dehydrogenase small subunit (CoxS/CutS family)
VLQRRAPGNEKTAHDEMLIMHLMRDVKKAYEMKRRFFSGKGTCGYCKAGGIERSTFVLEFEDKPLSKTHRCREVKADIIAWQTRWNVQGLLYSR